MAPVLSGRTTRDTRLIKALPAEVYRAFVDPALLVRWMAPETMTARMHDFDARVGGTYRMSLTYDGGDPAQRGKSDALTDTFRSRFTEVVPDRRIVQVVRFQSDKPEFGGEMTMIADFRPVADGTELTLTFENIPPGISLEDNSTGTRSSLTKLATLVE